MEAAVDVAAARLRGGAADALLGWRERHEKGGASGVGAIPRKPPRGVFAPLAPQTQTRTPCGDTTRAADVDWRALLRTLCRRFAGELVVEGKLLNQEELQVRRMARVGADGGADAVLALPSHGPAARFLVRCRDAPAARIGSVVAARVVRPHARAADSAVPVAAYRAEMLVASGPDGDQDMTTMERVFGFDVRHFVRGGAASQRQRRRGDRMHEYDDYGGQDDSDGDDELCANAAIMKHWTFSDLRGVRRLMEASELPPAQWTALLTAPAHGTDSAMRESDAWSHVSLAAAQKTLWAQERVARGDALRAKGRLKESLSEYDSALRLDEAHGGALLRRGQVHTELRRYEDAIRDFETLCALEPTNEAAMQGLLRAKGKLGHSKHVVAASFEPRGRSRSASRDHSRRKSPPRREKSEAEDETLVAFEEDRLRRLLEEEARARRRSRKRSSRRRSGSRSSSSSSDSDSASSGSASSRHRKRSRHKKSKKSKKASSSRDRKKDKKKKKRKARHDEESSRRRREDDQDRRRGHSSDSSAPSTRRERTSRERRRRSRSRSRARFSHSSSSKVALEPHNQPEDAVHHILARKPHRLWN